MTTYSSHRLVMGKVKNDNCFCLNGDIWENITEMFIEHMNFAQIAEFDWLPRRKILENLLLKNCKGVKLILCINDIDVSL